MNKQNNQQPINLPSRQDENKTCGNCVLFCYEKAHSGKCLLISRREKRNDFSRACNRFVYMPNNRFVKLQKDGKRA